MGGASNGSPHAFDAVRSLGKISSVDRIERSVAER